MSRGLASGDKVQAKSKIPVRILDLTKHKPSDVLPLMPDRILRKLAACGNAPMDDMDSDSGPPGLLTSSEEDGD